MVTTIGGQYRIISVSAKIEAIPSMAVTRMNIQNSRRLARPLKSKYCLIHLMNHFILMVGSKN